MTTLKIFSAPWCCNCKTVKTMLKDVPMEVVDADDESNTPVYNAANVQSIPTIIAYDEDGRETKRWSGKFDKSVIEEIKSFK